MSARSSASRTLARSASTSSWCDAETTRLATELANGVGQHLRVRVVDARGLHRLARWNDLVAGRKDRDDRLAPDVDRGDADRGEDACVAAGEDLSAPQHRFAGGDVGAGERDAAARTRDQRRRPASATPLRRADVRVLDHDDGIGAARHHAAGRDRDSLARVERLVCWHDARVNHFVGERARGAGPLPTRRRCPRRSRRNRPRSSDRTTARPRATSRRRRARGRGPRRAESARCLAARDRSQRGSAARPRRDRGPGGTAPALPAGAFGEGRLTHRARHRPRLRRRSPSLSSSTMTKPSARVVEESTEAPETESGSTRPSSKLDARVVQAPDRRADLARERPAHRPVRPLLRAAAESADRAAGEEVIGAERGDRIAGQQEDEPRADPAHPGRAARPHGDAVHGQLAVRRDERRRQILDADARSAGHDDDVRVGVQAGEDGVGVVAHQPGKVHDRTVALGECRQHRSVRVGDVKAVRRRARREQLVAGDDQPDARLPDDMRAVRARSSSSRRHPAGAACGRRRAPCVPRRCPRRAGRCSCRARPSTSRAMPRSGGVEVLDRLGRQHRVAAGGHRRAGHDAHGFAASHRAAGTASPAARRRRR